MYYGRTEGLERCWTIQVEHNGCYNGWELESDRDEVFVSAKGYPCRRTPAQFRTKAQAEKFLQLNREIIERRCGSKREFIGFQIRSDSDWGSITFDKPVSIARVGKRGPGLKNQIQRYRR